MSKENKIKSVDFIKAFISFVFLFVVNVFFVLSGLLFVALGIPFRVKWFCSEALAAALGFQDSWRFCPNTLHAALSRSARCGQPQAAAVLVPSE